ncbi:LytR C-terminal domain-containing protein [Corynebacterium variabile]|uniref:LytR C-terminal domain-containing protein n=1 Tax=Corynebacterium variabile TaxID=1727 RepID=UPI002897CEFC|nr:LytR C-terminal domain-containing protein [Corynebacterium variabile]
MTEQNRPRHSREPEQGPYDNSGSIDPYDDSYDEAYAYPAAAGAGAGAAGAGAAAAGAAGEPPEKSGPPLRGLAMILTAVAVVLIIWGAFSLFGGDDDSDDTASGSDTSATAPAPAPGEGDQGASEAPGTDDTEGADGADSASADPSSTAEAPAPGDDAGAGESSAEVDRGIGVTVLNNSTESGLSQSGADRVRDSDWSNVGFGNLQGRIDGISEESRVYYPEGNAAAQAAAEQVASDLGLQAAPGNADYYNRFREASVREGGAADAVVVVLTGPLG